jgi:hypothetical protein
LGNRDHFIVASPEQDCELHNNADSLALLLERFALGTLLGQMGSDPAAATPTEKETAGIYTIAGLRRQAGVRRSFLIEDLLLMGSTNILIGDSGLGKTPLLMQAGLCISSGRAFLGHSVVQGPVLYCDGESNIHEFIETSERISAYLGLTCVPDEFEVWSPNFDQSSSSGSLAEQLEAKVCLARPILVIVDTLRVFWPLAEAKTDTTMEMYGTHRRLTRDLGCTWATSHHVRKEDRKNPAILQTDKHRWFQEAAGSRALINHADTRLGVEPTSKGGADLAFAGFMRGLGWLEFRYLSRVRNNDGNPHGYHLVQGPDVLSPSFRQVYLDLLEQFKFTDVKKALGGTSDSNTVSFLEQCEAAGLIEKIGKCYQKIERVTT